MLIEIRTLPTRSKQNAIRNLIYQGHLTKRVNRYGILCYDDKELKRYKATHRKGRPPIMKD